MSFVRGNRPLLRLAAMTLNVTAYSLLWTVGGPVAYAFVAAAAMLMVIALATAKREALQLSCAQFRLELLLAGTIIVGILASTFIPDLPSRVEEALVASVSVLMAAFVVMMAVKTFRMLRMVTRPR